MAIELVMIVFEGDSIHKYTVEGMVETVVEMVTRPVVLEPFADDPGGQLACFAAEVPAWFSYDLVAQRVVAAGL